MITAGHRGQCLRCLDWAWSLAFAERPFGQQLELAVQPPEKIR
jgi:hypothetical protein